MKNPNGMSIEEKEQAADEIDQLNTAWIEDINRRWSDGVAHHKLSFHVGKQIQRLDAKNGDMLDLRFGGDGDNGEQLLYCLDILIDLGVIKL